VEKGPGGHGKKMTIWYSKQIFFFKACGKTCISVGCLLAWGQTLCVSLYAGGKAL
jgi:hypothetical protein